MHNPYAHSQGPAPATPEDQLLADYELAVGKNVEYYVPKFEEFDKGASQLGWNWPAFFFTTPWFLYRKMWGWGLGNAAYFWGMLTFVAPIVMGIAVGAAGKAKAVSTLITVGIIMGVLLAIPWFVLPMYANALYWRQIKKVIRDVPRSFHDQPDKRMNRIRRNGGVGAGAMIGVLAGAAFLFIFIIGILAAIAIPAYQDYTIRAQVTEGLNLAAAPKAAVAEYYAQHGEWPLDSAAAEVGEIHGTYVDAVRVANGSIVITYGGRANNKLASQRLIISPGLDEHEDIIWSCGEHNPPENVITRGPGPSGSDLPPKYLPVSCRP